MNVEDTGTGPAILALHGLGGGAYFFRGLAERLLPDYRVVAVDLPATPDASMARWVDALGALVDERIGHPVIVLGHSMGTIIGLEAWARWPERIRAAIFVGGVPQVAPHIRERLSERVRALAGATDLGGWGKRVSPGVFAASTFGARPEVVAAFERLFEMQSVEAYVRCCMILLSANAEAIVPTVTVPCLAITGEHDQYAPPDAVAAFIAQDPGHPRCRGHPRLRPPALPRAAGRVRGSREVVSAIVLDSRAMTSLIFRLAPVVLAVVMQTPAVEPGFTPLFNGKDFTGWKLSNAPSFTIDNGAIVAKAVGMQGHAFYDGPFMDHSFRNFELKVDVMTRQNSNGGVFILTEFVEKGWPSKGFEIQVNNSYDEGSAQDRKPLQHLGHQGSPVKDDEWFTEHIIVQGDTITIKVNDKQVVQWTLPKEGSPDFGKRTMTPGTIALQAHDPNSTVYYRNIRIKPLK